jgi:hypothetical protein
LVATGIIDALNLNVTLPDVAVPLPESTCEKVAVALIVQLWNILEMSTV